MAFAEAFSNGIKREDVFINTKLDNDHHAPELVEGAVRDSLKRLQLDYVDALLIHWPMHPEIVKVHAEMPFGKPFGHSNSPTCRVMAVALGSQP